MKAQCKGREIMIMACVGGSETSGSGHMGVKGCVMRQQVSSGCRHGALLMPRLIEAAQHMRCGCMHGAWPMPRLIWTSKQVSGGGCMLGGFASANAHLKLSESDWVPCWGPWFKAV